MRIKKALAGDIQAIHQILSYYAEQDLLLPRPLSELYDHLRDYFVLETIDRRHSIHGVCGLGICWEDLAEIKSLEVSEDLRRKGYGKELVEACLNEARMLALRKVFTLTYIPEFFQSPVPSPPGLEQKDQQGGNQEKKKEPCRVFKSHLYCAASNVDL